MMIDTIVLRIHNLHLYPEMIKLLRKEGEGQSYYDVENPHDKEVVDRETGEITKDQYLQIREITYEDTGKHFSLYKNKVLTSSHYYLAYSVRADRDFVEFNFSIPKYLFGTNILQFVTHKFDKPDDVTMEELNSMEYNMSNTYPKLMQFMEDFKTQMLPGIVINDADVEINRLDICYNQIFESEKDAKQYLEYQKRIKKKYLKEVSKNQIDWGTSIFLQTERYAAKIYHKGSEYTKKDHKHHAQMNEKLGRDHFPIEKKYDKEGNLIEEGFQSFADRILRYEITFKNPFISHLFKKHIFCHNCIELARLKEDHEKVKSVQRKISYYENKKEITEEDQSQIEYWNKKLREVPAFQKRNSRLYESIMNKRNSFRLRITQEDMDANELLAWCDKDDSGRPLPPKVARFSEKLLYEMFEVFKEFMKEFEIKTLDRFSDTQQRVIQYNQKVDDWNKQCIDGIDKKKSKINATYINSILLLMEQYSFDELVKNKIISRRTKYNYIKALEKIGIDKNHVASDSVEIIKSENFVDYHQLVGIAV